MGYLAELRRIMKKNLNFLISRGAIYYTCFSGAYFIISLIVQNTKPLEPKHFLSMLLFSYILALGSMLYRLEDISRVASRCYHAICFIGGFVLFLALCKVNIKPLSVAAVIFAVIYGIVATVSEIRRARTPKNAEQEPRKKSKPEYTSIFSTPSSEKDKRR